VCTPLPEEGRAQVAAFLARHPEYSRSPGKAALPFAPDDAFDDDGALRLKTYKHEADAFYAARLVRST
jgi:16S rRNA (cytosine967-C5)-methyltransferase